MVLFPVAPNEAGEASRRRGLPACARGRRADQLEHLHRRRHALDWHRTEGDDVDESLGEPDRLAGQSRRPGRRELLHARGQMRRLADRGVVHAEIAADGANYHFARIESDADL